MKKRLLSLLLAFAAMNSMGQQSREFGGSIGFGNYLGDLQSPDYTMQLPSLNAGLSVKANYGPHVAIRGFFNVGRISGDDSKSRDQFLINRNLSFRSNILEYGAALELNMLPFDSYNPHNKSGKRYFNFTPYLYGGLNVFHYNPKTLYNGTWVSLQPLNTEGQNSGFNAAGSYKLTQVAIPFGAGFKVQVSPKMIVSFDIGLRKTFTDYLDDVSGNYADIAALNANNGALSGALSFRGDELQNFNGISPVAGSRRGNPNNKDWYTINQLTIAYKLYNKGIKKPY